MNRMSGKMLLMLELAILLVFFCFAAAVCTHLFVAAKEKTEAAGALSKAVVQTTSIAETLKATGGDFSKTASLLQEGNDFDYSKDTLLLYYDRSFKPSNKSGGSFEAFVKKEELDSCNSYTIVIRSVGDKEEIYSLSFKAVKKDGGNDEIR